MILKRIKALLATTAFAVPILTTVPVRAAATTVITPSNLNGWELRHLASGVPSFVADSTAPLGTGALRLTTTADVNDLAGIRTVLTTPVLLTGVTQLSYQTRQVSAADVTNGNATLRLSIDTNGDNVQDDQLMYEPYYNGFNGTTMTGWQTWDVKSGKFWSNYEISYNGKFPTPAGGYDTNFNFTDVLASYPNAKVIGLQVSEGTYNVSQSINADNVKLNDTTYDFEPAPSTPTNKDQCKVDGWKTFNNPAYKNQGDCVSAVASKGKAKGNQY